MNNKVLYFLVFAISIFVSILIGILSLMMFTMKFALIAIVSGLISIPIYLKLKKLNIDFSKLIKGGVTHEEGLKKINLLFNITMIVLGLTIFKTLTSIDISLPKTEHKLNITKTNTIIGDWERITFVNNDYYSYKRLRFKEDGTGVQVFGQSKSNTYWTGLIGVDYKWSVKGDKILIKYSFGKTREVIQEGNNLKETTGVSKNVGFKFTDEDLPKNTGIEYKNKVIHNIP